MIAVENIFAPHPFVLSLSKDACRRDAHFEWLSASGISFRAPLLCSALDAQLWRQKASGLAGLRIVCGVRGGVAQ